MTNPSWALASMSVGTYRLWARQQAQASAQNAPNFLKHFFPQIDGIAQDMKAGFQDMKAGFQGIMLGPTVHFFFHAPDMTICGSMHDCSHSELHSNLTLPTQQMLGSIL